MRITVLKRSATKGSEMDFKEPSKEAVRAARWTISRWAKLPNTPYAQFGMAVVGIGYKEAYESEAKRDEDYEASIMRLAEKFDTFAELVRQNSTVENGDSDK
jgi:hypothetical protein